MNEGRLLQTRKEIMTKYGLTKATFQKFIKAGMPVAIIDGRYYALTANLDQFFIAITRGKVPFDPDTAE